MNNVLHVTLKVQITHKAVKAELRSTRRVGRQHGFAWGPISDESSTDPVQNCNETLLWKCQSRHLSALMPLVKRTVLLQMGD
jgi:hypothetical protein